MGIGDDSCDGDVPGPTILDRRSFLALIAAGAALTGCSRLATTRWRLTAPTVESGRPALTSPTAPATTAPTTLPPMTVPPTTVPPLPPIPAAHPGPPVVISQGPQGTSQLALTVDDGTSAECVAAYIDFARRSRTPLTFCPNGYLSTWGPVAGQLRPLIEAGQVQIANHTWSHRDLRRLSDADVRAQLQRNEDWIQRTFGVTARPWWRPPYGNHNAHVDALAGELGYTKVLLWNGTLGDSADISAATLLDLAGRYFRPGAIVLGHANRLTVTGLFDQLQGLLRDRGLQPATLDTMFGTSRATG